MRNLKLIKKIRIALLMLMMSTFVACNSVSMVDTSDDNGAAVAGLDYRDFEKAASEAVTSMIQSGAISKPDGSRYVLAVSRIKNRTTQMIDTDQLTKKVRVQLLGSGKVSITEALAVDGAGDEMLQQSRAIRENEEFKQSTVVAKGKLVSADFSLSGKIIENRLKMSKNKTQIEYYLQLTLTNLESGLAYWEGETQIVKRAKGKSANW